MLTLRVAAVLASAVLVAAFDSRAAAGRQPVRTFDVDDGLVGRIVADSRSEPSRRGERWCVMGKNGAGKTTLLKMVAGTLARDAGHRASRVRASLHFRSVTP